MIYACNVDQNQQPVHAKYSSKKRQRSKYKQQRRKLCERGDISWNKMSLEHKIPNVADLMEISLDRLITLATYDF